MTGPQRNTCLAGLLGYGIPWYVGLFCFAVIVPVEAWAFGMSAQAVIAGTVFGVFGYAVGRWTERHA